MVPIAGLLLTTSLGGCVAYDGYPPHDYSYNYPRSGYYADYPRPYAYSYNYRYYPYYSSDYDSYYNAYGNGGGNR